LSEQILKLLRVAKEFKYWMLLAAFFGFLTVGSNIGLMMTSAYLIAKSALNPSISELQVAIVGVRFFGISRGVFRYFERLISHEVTFNLLEKFRVWFFKILEPLFPSKISEFRSADLLKRVVTDVESLQDFYVRIIAPPLVAVMILVLFFFLFGMFSFLYSFIISFFFLVGGIAIPIIVFLLNKNYGSQILDLQKRLTELSIDQAQGISELLVFGKYKEHQAEFEKTNEAYLNIQRKMSLVNSFSNSLVGLLMNFAVISILVFAIPQVTSGILDGVYLSVLTLGTMAVFEAIMPLPELSLNLKKISISSENLFMFEEFTNEKEIMKLDNSVPINFSISIKSLNFSYNHNEKVLSNINLEIPQNKVTAIVGASGAGKSSLINILLKFWEYQTGEILFGNKNFQEISQNEIDKYFSVVPQVNHLFNLSIKENIKFAKPDSSLEEIEKVIEKANIKNFVDSLPNKYDELVGEQGLKLSGGERQRISIARALLKDSPIMIFDEPTSNLDAINEKNILEMIYELKQNKTVILITHRIINLDKADQIYVFDKGQIIEYGTHNSLIKENGFYKKMYNSQQNIIE
jgi:ATP-binding cassette, subfamily C, bacterial CydC